MTPRAQILLGRHSWPGNVRELENVIGHACMMVIGENIDVQDLPEYIWRAGGNHHSETAEEASAAPGQIGSLEEHERVLISRALETAGGNQSEAARLLRIGRDALRYKVKKYNL